MAEALAQVKRELGRDAVILHTRTLRRRGLLGFGGRSAVEITAATDVNVTPRRPRPARQAQPSVAAEALSAASAAGKPNPLMARAYGQRPSPAPDSGAAVGLAEAPAATSAAQAAGVAAPVAPPTAKSAAADAQLARELRELRSMVQQVVRSTSSSSGRDLPEPLFEKYLALLEQEVADELAGEVIQVVREQVGESLEDAERVDRAVAGALSRFVPTCGEADPPKRQADGRPHVVALIGPTGVGKTTTLAKLAATYKLRQKRSVGLVTIDTYRIAAVDQLQTYAKIIGVPLHVAQSPIELQQAVERCSDCDVVLVDTAGRSQRDGGKLEQLRAFLDAAAPHEVHLVLASNTTEKVMLEAVERFSAIRTDRIIFTKMDEAVSFGVVLNVVRRVGKQLSYITTGQEVPSDIEPGRADRLASLVMGRGLEQR